jgi:cardiolipin synthase
MVYYFLHNWPWVAALIDVALALTVTVHVVLWKRDARAAIGWAGLAWLAPLLGAIAYFWLGVNRIQRKAGKLGVGESQREQAKCGAASELDATHEVLKRFPDLAGLIALGGKVTERAITVGNKIEPLVNGDQTYPAMLEAISNAKQSVSLLIYIFDLDRAGKQFVKALIAAQGRGVEVRVLIDDVGSWHSRHKSLSMLHHAGVQAASFLRTRVPRLVKYANLRNHRKILVVDGRIGFTGGTNISERHWLSMNPKDPVQCLHFRIDGPVVAHIEQAFAADWEFTTDESLGGEAWFPKLEVDGPTCARGIAHGPDEDFEKIVDVILGALAVARRRVRIVTPYFLPDSSIIRALNVAAMRGVDVEILLPLKCDIRLVQWATAAQLWQLLEHGCRILYSAPPFDHTKVMVVDDAWSLIGSTNWDPRSFRLNFEFNVECYDEALANRLNAMVDEKVKSAKPVTLEEINARPIYWRLRDGLARLLSPYL